MSDHIPVTELAEAAEKLLPVERAVAVGVHLSTCPACAEQAAAVRQVSVLLRRTPAPPMPDDVARRLDHVIFDERARRTANTAYGSGGTWRQRPTLGPLVVPGGRPVRVAWAALVAAVAAGAVGFGGYLLSATAGLNEPPRAAVSVDTDQLAAGAAEVREELELDPHRFSRAWSCARRVTAAPISGLARAIVDGSPALLVYSGQGAGTTVTVVTGCDDRPSAAASATLSG